MPNLDYHLAVNRWLAGDRYFPYVEDDRDGELAPISEVVLELKAAKEKITLLNQALKYERDVQAQTVWNLMDLQKKVKATELEIIASLKRAESVRDNPAISYNNAYAALCVLTAVDGIAKVLGIPHPKALDTSPTVCTHPNIDLDGRCTICNDVVALAVPKDFAKFNAQVTPTVRRSEMFQERPKAESTSTTDTFLTNKTKCPSCEWSGKEQDLIPKMTSRLCPSCYYVIARHNNNLTIPVVENVRVCEPNCRGNEADDCGHGLVKGNPDRDEEEDYCISWCGTGEEPHPADATWYQLYKTSGNLFFCDRACWMAGRPINPRPPNR
jgi:hypothetical protein